MTNSKSFSSSTCAVIASHPGFDPGERGNLIIAGIQDIASVITPPRNDRSDWWWGIVGQPGGVRRAAKSV